jgi:HEAT repeat protein
MRKVIVVFLLISISFVIGWRLLLANAKPEKDAYRILNQAARYLGEKRTQEELAEFAEVIQKLAATVRKDEEVRAEFRRILREDPNPNKKQVLIVTLTTAEDPELAAILRALLNQKNDAVRALAIGHLGTLGATDALQELNAIAQTDPNPKLRGLAEKAIKNIEAISKGQPPSYDI